MEVDDAVVAVFPDHPEADAAVKKLAAAGFELKHLVITPGKQDKLVAETRLRGERHGRWLRDGEPNVAQRLAQIGVLEWMIVVPMLLGIFAGRWLDQKFNSGLFCTAPLLMFGAALGCWSAWKWMQKA